jgi:hypothetical protein
MIKPLVAGLLAALLLIAGAGVAQVGSAPAAGERDHPEAESYAASRNAMADVDEALERAGTNGAPSVLLMLTAQGKPVNRETATGWRNAASRSETAIYNELVSLAG